jgi:CRISPR-associated endonuclease/helicase Cas3
LSSQIIPKHRKPRIDKIKQSLENLKPIVLVTTQVIEAGMDFDFDIAVRDIGPIDSIVQTAGRCNRNGIKKYSESPFFIYRIVDDRDIEVAKYVYGRVSIEIANSLIHKNSNLVSLVESYYQEIQRRRSNQESDKINMAISELNYEEVEKAYNLIDEQFKVPVFVEFDYDATRIWGNFVNLSQSTQPTAPRPSRNEIIELNV